jgi:sensor histidine kinase YesM
MHIRSHLLFLLRAGDSPVYYAKSKGFPPSAVYISRNPDIHIKNGQYDYVMTVDSAQRNFRVSQKGESDPIATIFIDNQHEDGFGPRRLDVDLMASGHLISKKPVRRGSRWTLNFHGKYVVKSQKNAILVDEEEEQVLLVKKIERHVLELEILKNLSQFNVFIIALASFVCPV